MSTATQPFPTFNDFLDSNEISHSSGPCHASHVIYLPGILQVEFLPRVSLILAKKWICCAFSHYWIESFVALHGPSDSPNTTYVNAKPQTLLCLKQALWFRPSERTD